MKGSNQVKIEVHGEPMPLAKLWEEMNNDNHDVHKLIPEGVSLHHYEENSTTSTYYFRTNDTTDEFMLKLSEQHPELKFYIAVESAKTFAGGKLTEINYAPVSGEPRKFYSPRLTNGQEDVE